MKKYTKIILSLCLGISASLAQAYDGGAFPGYVSSPSGSSAGRGSSMMDKSIIKTQFGECVKNQYFAPEYQREECGEIIKHQDLSISSRVLFAYDKYELSDIGKKTLAKIIELAKQKGEISAINIVGYTDRLGTEEENQVLSEKRANEVGDYFVSLGIDSTYIDAKGKGETNSNVSEGCFAKDGDDPLEKIDALTQAAATASGEEKVKINNELKDLTIKLNRLSLCTAPDRRVDISIETVASAPTVQK